MLYRRILLTGANGLFGQALVQTLSRYPEYDLLATGLDEQPRYEHGSGGYTALDITDNEEVRRIFLDFAPDVVVNAAAVTNVDSCEENRERCWNVNVTAVEHLVRACRANGSRMIQISTDFVFDGSAGPYNEHARPSPINYYGRSKLAAENAVQALRTGQWSVARTVLVFGTGNALTRSNFALWVIQKLSNGEPIHVVTDQWRTPTFAPDLAEGVEQMIRFSKDGVYHLAGREFLSVYDIAKTIAQTLGLDQTLIHPTDASRFSQTAPRPAKTGFIILKAESELGFRPTPLPAAIRETAANCGFSVPASK